MVEDLLIGVAYPALEGANVYVVPMVQRGEKLVPRVPQGMRGMYFFGDRLEYALVLTRNNYLTRRKYARWLGWALYDRSGLSHFGRFTSIRAQKIIDRAAK